MRYRVRETRADQGLVIVEQLGAKVIRELKMKEMPELGELIDIEEPHRGGPDSNAPDLTGKEKIVRLAKGKVS